MVPGKLGAKPITDAEIERRFTYHRPEGQKIADHDDVRAWFKAFARDLNEKLPPGREASVCFTKLEEAANWAHAAIARPQADGSDPVIIHDPTYGDVHASGRQD